MSVRKWSVQTPALLVLALFALLAAGARADDAIEARMRRDVTYLASDECEGRGVTTKGINLAADYIANEFKKAGLKPAGPDGSYFQPFTMTGRAKLETPNTLTLHGPQGQTIQLELGKQFQPLGLSTAGKLSAPVVFVGYGATATSFDYDDYKGVDVAGKVVVLLRKTPRADNSATPFDGDESAHHAALVTKLVNADLHKAAAVLFVNDRDTAKNGDALMDFRYTAASLSPGKVPALHLRRAVLDDLLQSSQGQTLQEVEANIDRGLRPQSAVLAGWTAALEVNVTRTLTAVKNVVGYLEGAGPLAKETVVIGAHYDHLGYGGMGSLARNLTEPTIHHGADDNASGTTAVMELARRFARQQAQGREGRRLVFMAFSGEESGLLGSEHYCAHPLFPLADTAAMVNLDMVGRLQQADVNGQKKGSLQVYGTGTAKGFDALIEQLNKKYDFKLTKVAGGMGPSDHASFYAKKIPVIFFFTGDHPDYHRPSDTADKINVHGMARVTDLTEELAATLAHAPERPQYAKVAGGNVISSRSSGSQGPRLGIRPSYGDMDEGVLLSGVSEGGPADKAGLKEGDRIVEVGGKPVKNLEAYMVVMAGHKRGEAFELGILRSGKKLTVKIVPE